MNDDFNCIKFNLKNQSANEKRNRYIILESNNLKKSQYSRKFI